MRVDLEHAICLVSLFLLRPLAARAYVDSCEVKIDGSLKPFVVRFFYS